MTGSGGGPDAPVRDVDSPRPRGIAPPGEGALGPGKQAGRTSHPARGSALGPPRGGLDVGLVGFRGGAAPPSPPIRYPPLGGLSTGPEVESGERPPGRRPPPRTARFP